MRRLLPLLVAALLLGPAWASNPKLEKAEKELLSLTEKETLTAAEEARLEILSWYRGFVGVDCLEVRVYTGGDIAERTSFESIVRLRVKNNFANLPVCPDQPIQEIGRLLQEHRTMALYGSLMTAGEDYPIAYHVEFSAQVYGLWGPLAGGKYEAAEVLGITGKEKLDGHLREVVEQMVSEFAHTFFEVRGEL